MVQYIVAKYNENVDWTKQLNGRVTIYDKSEKPIEGSIKLKNVGREGETFLYHIVNNYDNLDDVTVFLQGNPFEHLNTLVGWRNYLTDDEKQIVINKMNNEINNDSKFTTFYQVLYNDPKYVNYVYTSAACLKYYGEQHERYTVSPGAQYIVPKKYILSRSLEFWKTLQKAMYNDELNGYCQEQLWYLAFTHTINKTVGSHDDEKHRCLCNNVYPKFETTPYSYFEKHNVIIP